MTSAIADADDRFGGSAWEGHCFEPGENVDAIRLEKTHYNRTLLPGYEYYDKSIKKQFPEEIDPEEDLLASWGWKKKKKSGVDFKVDFDGRYKKLLKSLKKHLNSKNRPKITKVDFK